jgi:phage host-nuclease inhibitor protein Gam
MSKSRWKPPSQYHEQAEDLLAQLAATTAELNHLNGEIAAKMQQVKDHYQPRIEMLQVQFKACEGALFTLAKRHKKAFFAEGADKLALPSGAVMMQLERVVRQARGVLAKLEELGRMDVIKVAKSVNWDALKDWTDDELAVVGTDRQDKERYSYEFKGI